MSSGSSTPGRPECPDDCGFLAEWSENDFGRLLLHTESHRFRAGEVVIRAGEVDRALYIIVHGKLEVLLPPRGVEAPKHIATLEAGLVVGEQAFLDGLPRSALVRATTDGELLRIGVEALAICEPALARSFLFDLGRILSLRLRKTTAATRVHVESSPIRVAPNRLLPLQRIEIDQEERAKKVAEITSSDFFIQLQSRARQLRRRAEAARG